MNTEEYGFLASSLMRADILSRVVSLCSCFNGNFCYDMYKKNAETTGSRNEFHTSLHLEKYLQY